MGLPTKIKKKHLASYRNWNSILTQHIKHWFRNIRKVVCVSAFESAYWNIWRMDWNNPYWICK